MNEKAKLIGMNDSQFKNADGMPAEGQWHDSPDMAILAKRYLETIPSPGHPFDDRI